MLKKEFIYVNLKFKVQTQMRTHALFPARTPSSLYPAPVCKPFQAPLRPNLGASPWPIWLPIERARVSMGEIRCRQGRLPHVWETPRLSRKHERLESTREDSRRSMSTSRNGRQCPCMSRDGVVLCRSQDIQRQIPLRLRQACTLWSKAGLRFLLFQFQQRGFRNRPR